MRKLFNKILIPVDFSSRSKSVIGKAVKMAGVYDCDIHLLHVVTNSPFSTIAYAEGHMFIPYNALENEDELRLQLQKLCDYARLLADFPLQIEFTILKGTWEDTLEEVVETKGIDLVLIGQSRRQNRKRKMLLNPDKIAEKIGIPVATIPLNRRMTKLYSIVIPVTDFLPARKLMYGIYIASKYNTTIKLLGVQTMETRDKVAHFLSRARQLIKEHCDISVETDIVFSENIANALHRFTKREAADLVIVNPGTQTGMPGFLPAIFGNIIQKYSSPPVLAVTPFL